MRMIFVTTLTMLFGWNTWGQEAGMLLTEGEGKHFNTNSAGVLLDGYDIVSYFDGAPKAGSNQYVSVYAGISFWFSSKENKANFERDPGKYLPQFGGWCATGMAYELVDSRWPSGKYKIEPNTYLIEDEKLYLFYNFEGYDASKDWTRQRVKLLPKAEQTWSDYLDEKK